MPPALTLVIPGRATAQVADYADASRVYLDEQTNSGEGASTFPTALVTDNGKALARVSYNGRVWTSNPDGADRLVYCPASAGVDEGRPDIFNAGRESEWGKRVPNPHTGGSVEHTVFARGAAFALKAYAS